MLHEACGRHMRRLGPGGCNGGAPYQGPANVNWPAIPRNAAACCQHRQVLIGYSQLQGTIIDESCLMNAKKIRG
jgi:hypothetical protein